MAAPNPFWRFSLRTWRLPGIQKACLDLQERCGADVNLLLFCAWAGRRGRRLDRRALRQAIERVKAWQSDVVAPVRLAQRHLKRLAIGNGATGVGLSLRRRLAALELDLERAEQSMLWQLEREWGPPADRAPPAEAIACNLARYLELLPASPWPSDLAHLDAIAAAALPSGDAQRERPSQAFNAPAMALRTLQPAPGTNPPLPA